MATLLSSLESQARLHLLETTASFWSSAELIDICNLGIKDLWGAIVDLHQEHFFTVDATNVSLAANTATLTGVPTDVFRVLLIEPRDTSSAATGRNIEFIPRDYNSPEFSNARASDDEDPSGAINIYYAIAAAGAPIGAPTIHIAPQLSSALLLRLVYIPIQAAVLSSGNNPIPGESDNALIAWIVAYARAKEREDRAPDPGWLAIYSTEKQGLLTRLTPRQEQEPEHVRSVFEGYWQ